MTFIESRGSIDPRLTPILAKDMARPFLTLELPNPLALMGLGSDVTSWAEKFSHGNIEFAAGTTITLKNNHAYELTLTQVSYFWSAAPGDSYSQYAFVDDVTNVALNLLAWAWSAHAIALFNLGSSGTASFIFPVTGGNKDIKVRCVGASAGTHNLWNGATSLTVKDLGLIA